MVEFESTWRRTETPFYTLGLRASQVSLPLDRLLVCCSLPKSPRLFAIVFKKPHNTAEKIHICMRQRIIISWLGTPALESLSLSLD